MNQNLCGLCGQVIPTTRGRRCAACKHPIKARHKYIFVGSVIQHKDCSNPEMKSQPEKPQPRLIEEAQDANE